jgi:hypoxanthine phosphoribosyltransferase
MLFNVISLIVGVSGILVSVFFGLKSKKLEKEKLSMGWNDLEGVGKYLCSRLEPNFIPDIICTLGNECGNIVCAIEKHFYKQNIITLIGTKRKKGDSHPDEKLKLIGTKREKGDSSPDEKYYEKTETFSWELYLPRELWKYKDKKILLVDDIAITGNFLSAIRKLFNESGFQKNNIKIAYIVTTKSAMENEAAPDYYYKIIDESHFYFP